MSAPALRAGSRARIYLFARTVLVVAAACVASAWATAAWDVPVDFPRTAVFSPDGQRVITTSSERASLWRAADGALLASLPGGSWSPAAFSPDGRTAVVMQSAGDVVVWDLDAPEHARVLLPGGGATRARFLPDGGRVLLSGWDGLAAVFDVHTGERVLTIAGLAGFVEADLSADATRIATIERSSGSEQRAQLWRADTGALVATLGPARERELHSVRFSSDGTRLATIEVERSPRRGVVRVWDARTGALVVAIRDPRGDDHHRADALRATQRRGPLPRLPPVAPDDVAFSTDGNTLLVASWQKHDADATLHALPSGDIVMRLTGDSGRVSVAALSRDGRHAVTGTSDGTATLWDVASGTRVATLGGSGRQRVATASFAPDDTTIVTLRAQRWPAQIWNRDGNLVATLRPRSSLLAAIHVAGARLLP